MKFSLIIGKQFNFNKQYNIQDSVLAVPDKKIDPS